MSQRKKWAIVLIVVFLMIAIVELSRELYLSAGMFGSFAASAMLIALTIPQYKSRRQEIALDLSYIAVVIGIFLYAIQVVFPELK